jgi:hypothetical protein
MNEPIRNAYPDEQEKLDKELENEGRTWAQINEVLKSNGYNLNLRLVDGLPDLFLSKVA